MTGTVTMCPQCGAKGPGIGQYDLQGSDDGAAVFVAYYFTCCGELVKAWGYTDEWAEQQMGRRG
jgi:hypothetical protein